MHFAITAISYPTPQVVCLFYCHLSSGLPYMITPCLLSRLLTSEPWIVQGLYVLVLFLLSHGSFVPINYFDAVVQPSDSAKLANIATRLDLFKIKKKRRSSAIGRLRFAGRYILFLCLSLPLQTW